MGMNMERALKVANEAADLGRKVLLDYFGDLSEVQEKEMAGLVSEADLTSEKVIVAHLKKHFPESEILGEEGSFASGVMEEKNHKMGRWVIDPLDGTTNYVHKLPIYCISIGLEIDGEYVLGLIDVPGLGDRYHAIKGGGSFKNGQPISVSQRDQMDQALLATGFFPPNKDALREQVEVFSCLLSQVRGVRRLGAAAYDLCLVAEGVFDVFWERNLSPWDTAAGFLLVEEAGGVVTSFDQDTYTPFLKSIIAGSKKLQATVKEKISSVT